MLFPNCDNADDASIGPGLPPGIRPLVQGSAVYVVPLYKLLDPKTYETASESGWKAWLDYLQADGGQMFLRALAGYRLLPASV